MYNAVKIYSDATLGIIGQKVYMTWWQGRRLRVVTNHWVESSLGQVLLLRMTRIYYGCAAGMSRRYRHFLLLCLHERDAGGLGWLTTAWLRGRWLLGNTGSRSSKTLNKHTTFHFCCTYKRSACQASDFRLKLTRFGTHSFASGLSVLVRALALQRERERERVEAV